MTKAERCGIIFSMNAVMTNEDVPRLVDEAEIAQSLNWSVREVAKAAAEGAMFVVLQDGQQWHPSFFLISKESQPAYLWRLPSPNRSLVFADSCLKCSQPDSRRADSYAFSPPAGHG